MKEKGLLPLIVILILIVAAIAILTLLKQAESKWQEKGIVIAGQYTDAEVNVYLGIINSAENVRKREECLFQPTDNECSFK